MRISQKQLTLVPVLAFIIVWAASHALGHFTPIYKDSVAMQFANLLVRWLTIHARDVFVFGLGMSFAAYWFDIRRLAVQKVLVRSRPRR